MGRRRRGRPVDGILVLDKPSGLSSNQALQTAKRLYFAAKAGHTGSLDPLATGVLPLCFGEATKFSSIYWTLTRLTRVRLYWALPPPVVMPRERFCNGAMHQTSAKLMC